MIANKPKVIMDYQKLAEDLKEQLKLVYPDGFHDNIIWFNDSKGQRISALRFETDEKIYMLRMSAERALEIMDDDDDFGSDYKLKSDVQKEYADKHSDVDYLPDNLDEDDDIDAADDDD
ncbi:hypothetical protein KDU71_06525 [Carboxylicivirga sediminis]|uniref:Uncharacterized protein n=1 Tax=Carboxylicivirga sediminis TaxID=2006564 RepID=A0A941F2J9_9BACT|nr:hypothetical protein [Carboxylicivirga sediminis]MBR8535207.1 hypothetical protein [Carboxylicivirga sediminis]